MALRKLEGFDHYTAVSDGAKMWTNFDSANSIASSTPRNGVGYLSSGSNSRQFDQTFDAQATWVVGFGFRRNSIHTGLRTTMGLFDSTTIHVGVGLNTSHQLVVYRGQLSTGGTLLATGSTVFSSGTWYYVEVYITIHDTAGVVKVQINGVSETLTFVTGTETTQDTRNGGNATANIVAFQCDTNSSSFTCLFDDIYICDGTTGDADNPNNDFLGDIRVETLLPSGAGNSAQFTPSAGSNYQNVDEATPNGDTDYNQSSTTGHIDDFAMANLSGSGSIKGAELLNYARKTDAGSAGLAPLLRISSTNYAGSEDGLSVNYSYVGQPYDVSPATGVAFTSSEIDGLTAGYKKSS